MVRGRLPSYSIQDPQKKCTSFFWREEVVMKFAMCFVFCYSPDWWYNKKIFKTIILRSFSTRVRKNHELIYDFICSNLSTSSHIFFNCNQNRHSSYTVKFINASLTVKTCFESLNACWQKKFNSYKNYLLIPTVFDSDKI